MSNIGQDSIASATPTAVEPQGSNGYVNEYHDFVFSGKVADAARDPAYEYTDLLPTYPKINWEPLKLQEDLPEPGRQVQFGQSTRKGALLNRSGVKYTPMSPTLGLEVTNVDLRDLTILEKNELGRMIAEHGVVVFRGQPHFTVHDQANLVSHFGPFYKHPSSGIPSADLAHIRVLYQGPNVRVPPAAMSYAKQWHLDSAFEINPPGIVSMQLLRAPESGGDTVFTSGYDVYDYLSKGYQQYLEPLKAEHRPGYLDLMKMTLHQRRPITANIHPVVCVHPVTGWKSTFVDKLTTRSVVGLPLDESDMLIEYLGTLAMQSINSQIRVRWDTETVAFWDNRCVFHSATFNYWPEQRHTALISATANRPMSVEEARKMGIEPKSRGEDMMEKMGYKDFKVIDMTNGRDT
ncbi:hypothetical protein GGX14DRAFT_406171 [Mycena pura]|uniref:TauD/TfdA-like domain-containing protein n=1 Tax=Mycena pura TaxID=153505 RepID=A0AAD6UUW4_9AGAR|nr:hypothetical protein GGX14DRAFT_406171 [Mycena pura]